MATIAAAYHEREMSIGRVFSRAFATIGHNPLVVIGLAFFVGAVPTLLLTYFAAGLISNSLGVARALIINGWVSILVGALVQGTMTRAVVADAAGRRASLSECFAAGLRVLLPMVGLSIVIGFCVGVGMILLLVPGLMGLTMWYVALPALAEERDGVIDALGRSADLTEGARWKIFAIFLIIAVANALIGGVYGLLVGIAHLHMYSTFTGAQLTLASGAVTLLLHTMLYTIWGAVQPSAYIELREWKEGGSMETLGEVFA